MLGIFATGRNGSTLLMRLLDGSPDLWIYPIELDHLGKRDWLMRDPDGFDNWARGQHEVIERDYLPSLDDPLGPIRALETGEFVAGAAPEPRLLAFFDRVRDAYAPSAHPHSMHAFKTREVWGVDRYRELFPGLRCLHIVRDPLKNYASLKRELMVFRQRSYRFEGEDMLETFLERGWLPHARRILEARHDPEGHFATSYEELVREPARVLTDICSWLGVRLPEDPDLQTVLGGRRLREQPRATDAPMRPARPLRPDAELQARRGDAEIVTRRERDLIRLVAGDLAAELGYDLAPDAARPGRLRLLGEWVLPDRWEILHADSKLRLAKALVARRLYVYRKLLA